MTIPDMAAAFKFNGTVGAQAIVDCHNGKRVHVGHGATGGLEGDNPKWCNHPQFGISRDIVLPIINQSAANVFDRIIPAPGGDCKLLDAASNAQAFPLYNLTVTGLPVSIACNLTAQDSSLPALSPTSFANQSSHYVSPANESTNGQAGAYVAPPPAKPFSVAFNSSNSVCISGSGPTFCLPNGTYDQPSGATGYSISGASAVTIPRGASITLTGYILEGVAGGPPRFRADETTFNSSQASSTGRCGQAVGRLNEDHARGVFSIFIPPSLPQPAAACFYSKPRYRGDVFCMGPGGANFSGPEIKLAQSVGIFGNATAWIYAQAYGDSGGQKLSASVPDLSTEPYGTGGNFSQRVVAAWIYASQP